MKRKERLRKEKRRRVADEGIREVWWEGEGWIREKGEGRELRVEGEEIREVWWEGEGWSREKGEWREE